MRSMNLLQKPFFAKTPAGGSIELHSQSGSALLPFIIVIPFLMLIAGSIMSLTVSSFSVARGDQLRTHAQLAADAGVDISLQEINQDETWAGTGSEILLHDDGQVVTKYEASVAPVPGTDDKILTSIGRSYSPTNLTTPLSTIRLDVNLRAVTTGSYSVVSGVGGLIMSNNSKILGGDVLINGIVQMQNSAQIGLTTGPVTVEVAHQNCPNPADATYPLICNSGENGEPISIQNNAHIYGSVSANNQTNGADMSDPGLVASSGVSSAALPTHLRDTQKSNVATTTSDSYYTNCDANNETRTWPARLKIEGDVSIKKSCRIILEGDVWITGRLTIQNSAEIVTSDTIVLGGQNTVDANLPTIMVDGSAGVVAQNSASLSSNTNDVGMQVITYWSRATCSPDCTDVTGTDLYASRNDRTILLQNSAQGPNTILYARWTLLELSNGGGVGAVIGQTVRLSNSATITFGASTAGSSPTFWVIDGYRRIFD